MSYDLKFEKLNIRLRRQNVSEPIMIIYNQLNIATTAITKIGQQSVWPYSFRTDPRTKQQALDHTKSPRKLQTPDNITV